MKRFTRIILAAVLPIALLHAEGGKLTTHPEAIKEFQNWRFGMFIHWGPVSLKGTEIGWSRGREVPIHEYDQLYREFNPTEFNADAWARTAKETGMKYLVLTTKHHDGFCLWPTQQRPWISATNQRKTPYSIVETPFKRDICKELSEACKKHGIAFCVYYSLADWYHFDWTPRYLDPRPTEGVDMDRYVEYLKAQCGEIIKNYDPKLFWFDGDWFKTWTPDRAVDLYQFMRTNKDRLVINNRVGTSRQAKGTEWDPSIHAGDYGTPEQHIGKYSANPWETCMTIGRQWAWKPNDQIKSTAECIQSLVKTSGANGNFLFNVGPMPDGRIEPRQVERLGKMGAWLRQYGESIYGTRGGPFLPKTNILSTRKGNAIYLHLLNRTDAASLPIPKSWILQSKVLSGGAATFSEDESQVTTVKLSEDAIQDIDAVIALTLDRSAMDMETRSFITP